MTGIMVIFYLLIRILSIFGSSRSFVSSAFALYVDRELSKLKRKLVITTPLKEQILQNFVFKGCEISIDGTILKMNLI